MSESNNDEQLSFDFDEIKLDDIEVIDISSFTLDTSTWANNTFTTVTGSTVDWSNGYNIYSPVNTVNIDKAGISMEAGTDIKIGNKSIVESIEKIEERLGILHPNPELEDRWEQLKTLRNQYMELEKDILEKEKILNILKNT